METEHQLKVPDLQSSYMYKCASILHTRPLNVSLGTPLTGIKRTDSYQFYSDLEFVRPIYFAKNEKKKKSKNYLFFGKVPELKYWRSLKMVTNLHNRSKQSDFPARIHQVSHCRELETAGRIDPNATNHWSHDQDGCHAHIC